MGRDTGRRGDTRRETGEDIVHSGELEGSFLIFSRMTGTTTTGGRETATTTTGGGTTGTVLYCTALHCTVLNCTVLYRTVIRGDPRLL